MEMGALLSNDEMSSVPSQVESSPTEGPISASAGIKM